MCATFTRRAHRAQHDTKGHNVNDTHITVHITRSDVELIIDSLSVAISRDTDLDANDRIPLIALRSVLMRAIA